MTCQNTMWKRALPLALFVSINLHIWVKAEPQVPCFFIFGDSLSDSGNNNGLMTLAKANFLPYGIDFPSGPTGRFTNGRTTVDLIGEYLGLENYIPPFPTAKGHQILKGVNYASGSAGIRNETGRHVGDRIPMDAQLLNHQNTISRIARLLGNDSTARSHLNKCLYSVYVGSNDYMMNYYMPTVYPTSRNFNTQQYTDALIAQYTKQLKALYEYGARNVVLFGLSPLGCLPMLHQRDKCADNVNSALQVFNSRVKSLVDEFNKNLNDAKFIFINTYEIVSDNLSAQGTRIKNVPCCGVGEMFCLPYSVPCRDRNGFAYWDNAHPTEAANKVLATRAFSSQGPNDTYPMDISHLIAQDQSTEGPGIGWAQGPPSPSGSNVGGFPQGPSGTGIDTPTVNNGFTEGPGPFGISAPIGPRQNNCWILIVLIIHALCSQVYHI